MNPGRNAPCPCGSGKKYKQCCGKPESGLPVQSRPEETRIAAPDSRVQGAPPPDEISRLVALYNAGRHAELENRARLLVERYPGSGLGWKLLSASLLMQGKDALLALQNATKFLSGEAELHNNLGDALWKQGRGSEAEASFRRALQIKPDYADAHYNLSRILMEQGRLDEAEAGLRHTLRIQPNFADALNNLGSILMGLGRFAEADKNFRQALKIQPDFADAHNNLCGNLIKQGRYDEAEPSLRRALEIKPDIAEAHCNLGVLLINKGRSDEAEASLRRALEIKPGLAEAHSTLGNVLAEQGRFAEAEASLRRALEIKPDLAEAHSTLGNCFTKQGRSDEAEASLRRALEIKPDLAEAHCNLGPILMEQGRIAEAEASLRLALKIKPDYADAHCNLGPILMGQGRIAEAEGSLRRALEIKSDFAVALNNLGNVLTGQCRFAEAEGSLRRALEIKPDFAIAHNNLSGILQTLGRLDEAEVSLRRVLAIKPDYAEAHSSLLFLYAYYALADPREYLAQARNWERNCLTGQDRQVARDRSFNRAPLAGRRLRVGYVSGDYRQHTVSYFIERLFAHHDRVRIELFAYSTQGKRDAVTEHLQALAEHWVPVAGMTDTAVMDRIESDGIDVLIDLSGHTRHNRLGVFARRAAPVQAHYLGYFASTGLTEMDYWIGDDTLIPAETDSQFSEQVWRLPRVWVSYEGKVDAPLPDWQPAQGESVWLGSFNNLGKLTLATLALWAKVLHALPEGKLLLKTKELSDTGNRQRILNAMSGHGIPADRIELQGSNATPGWREHMAYYNRLDIALDPVGGVGGGTTTCDALWMGVPVITLEGDRMASRMTDSMLNAIGHAEWVARSEAEYIDKVVALARDMEQRKTLRYSQRARMATSPLCDAGDLAMKLEDAYFEMFERWLAR